MAQSLKGKTVAILVTDGFEQVELTEPKKALEQAGAKTVVVSPKKDRVQGWNHSEKGDVFTVDLPLDEAEAAAFDALLLPGGLANPDRLRMSEKAVEFVAEFVDDGKPIAAICHGPWTLIEAHAVRGRTVTSWPSLKTDLRNAGARWLDQPVVVDEGLVTSRRPDDIPAFNAQMIEAFAAGRRERRSQRHAAHGLGSQPGLTGGVL